MRLLVSTPAGVIVDTDDVRHVRAEDASGAFGLLEHHDNLLTVLAVSVVTWRDQLEHEHHVAVRGGVLTMTNGHDVEIATREAQQGDDLAALERDVVARYRTATETAAAANAEANRLESAIVRQVLRYLRPGTALPTFREDES